MLKALTLNLTLVITLAVYGKFVAIKTLWRRTMNIVGVTACTVGIAHTYIAQKKIEIAAKKAGHNVKIETQGTIGIENALTDAEIAQADIVLLAADVKVSGEERFAGKRVVKVATETAVKSPNKLIEKLSEIVNS
jgi:PTS system fructose-specific IIB component